MLAQAVDVRLVDQGTDLPAWISAVATAITLGVVIATVWVAYFALRDARRTRHGQLITELMRDWTAPSVVEAQNLHGEYTEQEIIALVDRIFAPAKPKPTPEHLDDWAKLSLVANLIETLGVLTSEKAITAEVVYKMWGGVILTAWPKWDDAVRRLRKYDNEPDTFEHFEHISLEIERIRERNLAGDGSPATSSGRHAPRDEAGAELEMNGQSRARPRKSDVSNGTAYMTRASQVLALLFVVSVLFHRLRRRPRSN